MLRPSFAVLALVVVAGSACDTGPGPSGPSAAAPLVLAAGLEEVEPAADTGLVARVDLQRLGLARVDRVYRLTTPVDEPFAFDVVTRGAGNAGNVRVSIAHALDDGATPQGGAGTIAAAGCIPSATGIVSRDAWLDAHGDGFARITVRGAVDRNQVLAFVTESEAEDAVALVELAVGPVSRINLAAQTHGNHPGVVEESTLYTSDSWYFGLPTVAVSGDRTSVVVYEGDRVDWQSPRRYELRMQHEHATGTVTGGGSDEASVDSGHWRDHEIAALYNVLALAHCGTDEVTVKLSFDRGATFAQTAAVATSSWSTRLVQLAIAADYSLAVVFWRTTGQGLGAELTLVEGRPVGFDAGGSPTWFAFDPPQVIHPAAGDVTPLLTGVAWSDGGDLVVGHGFSQFERNPDGTWTSTTQFRCAVRPWGGEFRDRLVDEEIMVGRDPSVALLGSGVDLQIFYAYEGRQGTRLRVSRDAGVTFSAPVSIGQAGAHTPTVFAREIGGATRVDIVYLAHGDAGSELHLSRWLDFGTSQREDYRLTTSVMTPSANAPAPANPWFGPINYGNRLTQVAWFGYDAVLDGDEIVVVYDEETFDAAFVCGFALASVGAGGFPLGPQLGSPGFQAAQPPPLAPGMTEPLPAPKPEHRHQLKLLRLN